MMIAKKQLDHTCSFSPYISAGCRSSGKIWRHTESHSGAGNSCIKKRPWIFMALTANLAYRRRDVRHRACAAVLQGGDRIGASQRGWEHDLHWGRQGDRWEACLLLPLLSYTFWINGSVHDADDEWQSAVVQI